MEDGRLIIFFLFWYQLMCVSMGFGMELAAALVRFLKYRHAGGGK